MLNVVCCVFLIVFNYKLYLIRTARNDVALFVVPELLSPGVAFIAEAVGEKSGAADIRTINILDTTAVKNWLVSGTDRQLTKTLYDDPVNLTLQSYSTSRKRVVASIYLENSGDAEGDSTLYSYDILGNVKTLVQHIKALVAVDATNGKKRIDYDYDLVSGKVNMVSYQYNKGDQFFYKYHYDADNRVIRSYSSRDKLIWMEDASYNYYLHGPLAKTELGNLKVQGIDYMYTLQGWLKGINSNALSPQYEMGQDGWAGTLFARVSRDVYSFGLGYFNQDYTPVGGSGATAMSQAVYQHPSGADNTGRQLFNGNISNTIVSLSKIESGAAKGYSYGYDQLNRLVFMNQHTVSGSTWSNTNIISAYAESIAYDANGNILKYLRKGANVSGMPLNMDSLGYKYNRDVNGNLVNNKLTHVKDTVSNSNYTVDIDDQNSNNYEYDLIGNLKKDVAEGIDTIRWTVYGKINKIVKNGSDIEFRYDPGGNRTSKRVFGSSDTTTFYIRDAQGNVLAVYTKKGEASLKWDEQHLYGSSRLGIWNWDTIVPTSPPIVDEDPIYDSLLFGSRHYELSNHLGNVLSVISDKKIGNDSSGVVNYYIAEVLSQNDYYPFGMLQVGRGFQAGSNSYRYSINGQEKEKELSENITSAEFWMYDSRIARRWNIDPIFKENESPYASFGNNPIWNIDVDGADTTRQFVVNTISSFANDSKERMNSLTPRIQQLMAGISKMKTYFNSYLGTDFIGGFNPLYFAGSLGRQLGQGEDPIDYMAREIANRVSELSGLVQEYNTAYQDYQSSVKSMQVMFKNSTYFELENGLVLDRVSGSSPTFNGNLAGLIAVTSAAHKNNKTAQSSYALYEIVIEGQTFKFGIADANRIRKGGLYKGYPERLAQQLSKLSRLAPNLNITAEIRTVLQTTKAEMLLLETKTILAHAKNFGIPIGNASHVKKWAETFGKSGLAAKALKALNKFLKIK